LFRGRLSSRLPIQFVKSHKVITLKFQSLHRILSISLLILLVQGCSSLGIPIPVRSSTSPEAQALLTETQNAHGKEAFSKINDIAVSYDGVWPFLITKIQPKITDPQFRKTSQDRMLLREGAVVQFHQGSGGGKFVWRESDKQPVKVSVTYNGKLDTDIAMRDASHLVLEAYQLFLMPAFYIQRAAWLELGKTEYIDGASYETLIAVMRPGFGNALEDRTMLYIDPKTKLVKRVRLTLEGTATTKGAFVETTYLAYKTIEGVVWPTQFYEALVSPFPGLPAHDFWLTGLDINRGLTKADFEGAKYSVRAAEPAKSLPK
jgi:hypothetical protein